MNFSAFPSREALMEAAALRLHEAIVEALTVRGRACLALSGGTTPAPAYAKLAAHDLDWRKVTFTLVDERFVPPAHEASNEAMLRRALAPALAHGATLAPMFAPAPSLDAAAAQADRAYAGLSFDLALMGMGADAHTASWFPGAAGLAEALAPGSARTVVAIRAPHAAGAAERLTLTRAALGRASRVALLITGADKRNRLEAALNEPEAAAPVAALFAGPGPPPEVLWAA